MEIITLFVIIVGFVCLAYILLHGKSDNNLVEVIRMLQSGSSKDRESLNIRLDNATRVISDLQRNVGEMSEIGKSMKELQEFILSPKLRGNIGEQVLRELLGQMLPKNSFHLQYAFDSGEKVDAAITTSGGIIPIDSKFPMENFRKIATASKSDRPAYEKLFERDIKTHIDAISKKYILPEEGTTDYGLMYIPSESVYYEVVNSQNLYDYSITKRVLPVSPTTFYAYLRAILMSFEGQKIEAQAKQILSSLKGIQKEYTKVEENLSVLQKHLQNATNMMGSVLSGFSTLGQKISNTKSLESNIIPNDSVKEIKP